MSSFCTLWTTNPRDEVIRLDSFPSESVLAKLAMWRALLPDNELRLDLGINRGASEMVYAADDQEML